PPQCCACDGLEPRLLLRDAWALNSSATPAIFPAPAGQRSRARSAADDKDELRSPVPAPRPPGFANSAPDCGCRLCWQIPPAAPSFAHSTHQELRASRQSWVLSTQSSLPRSACRQSASPPAPSATRPSTSYGEIDDRKSAA